MPKPSQPRLFPGEAADDVQRATYKTEDEKAFEKERKRRKPKQDDIVGPPDDGPCCLRCDRWLPPHDSSGFGKCRFLAVMSERVPSLGEKGTVVSVDEALAKGAPYALLNTRAGYGTHCSAFVDHQEAESAA